MKNLDFKSWRQAY